MKNRLASTKKCIYDYIKMRQILDIVIVLTHLIKNIHKKAKKKDLSA